MSPRIYIVDDDDAVRWSLQALLESYGFMVQAFKSGSAFLENYSNSPTSCLLLDVHMPEVDGIETLTRLRRDLGSDMPVVMITGRNDRQLEANAFKAGATLLLEKPIDSHALIETMEALIENQNGVAGRDVGIHT